MVFRANPAFDRYPAEAALVGRILSGFGEIEVSVCDRAAKATGLEDNLMKALYGIRVTSTRIETADRLMRPYFEEHGLTSDYTTMVEMVWYCLKIRNQYAHCNWGDDPNAGLFFADLQVSADTVDFSHSWRHVDIPLLEEQFNYLGMTLEQLEFVHNEMGVKMGKIQSHVWPKPTVPRQSPLHNPPERHIPPWLNADQQALHLARALAARGGPPTPTPGQQAQDKARAEKRAWQEEQRRKSREGEQNARERSDPNPET